MDNDRFDEQFSRIEKVTATGAGCIGCTSIAYLVVALAVVVAVLAVAWHFVAKVW